MSENKNIRKKFLLVEPDNNIIYPMEDYNILVDLIVRNSSRSTDKEKNIEELSFVLGTYKFSESNVNEEKKLKSTMSHDYSTSYLDVSANEIFNDGVNKECLGVDTIDIDYSNWQFPQVTIKFTDVRAQALMMPEENIYTHSLVDETRKTEDGNTYIYEGYSAEKKAHSLFTSFFRFPYPEFILKVKGFYGHAISFRLTVNEFTSSFNSDTGNFDITVSFIGHLYGFLTDIPMRYIVLSPYIDGKEYWDGIIGNKEPKGNNPFTFDGVTPIPTFLELVRKILNVNDRLNNITSDDEDLKKYKNIQNRCKLLSNIVKRLQYICGLLKKEDVTPESLEKEYNSLITLCDNYIYDTGCGEDIKKICLKTNDIEGEINLIKCLEYCIKNISNSEENFIISSEGEINIINLFNSNKLKENRRKIAEGFRQICLSLNKKINELEGSNKENIITLSEKLEKNVIELLGFNPTIENIFKIIFAHIDTFIYHYNKCISDINKTIYDGVRIKLTEENSDVHSVNGTPISAPPFPLIHSGENNSKGNNGREYEILYPTQHKDIIEGDMPELMLVDKMLNSASRMVNNINSLFTFVDNKIEMIPTTVIDVINGYNNPYAFYKYGDVVNLMDNNYQSIINDSLSVLSFRSILYSLLNEDEFDSNLMSTIGETESYNFFNIHKDNDVILNGIISKIEEYYNIKNESEYVNTVSLVNNSSKGFITKNNDLLSNPQEKNSLYKGIGIINDIVTKQDIPVNFYSKQDIIDSFTDKNKYYENFIGKSKNKYEFYVFEDKNTYDNFVNLFEKIENDENIELSRKNKLYDKWKLSFTNINESKKNESKGTLVANKTNYLNVDNNYGDICKLPTKVYSNKDDFESEEYTKYHFKINNENYQKLIGPQKFEGDGTKLYYKNFIHNEEYAILYYNQNENIDGRNNDIKSVLLNKAFIFLSDKYWIENNNLNYFIVQFFNDINSRDILRVSHQTLIYIGSLIWCCKTNRVYNELYGKKYNIQNNYYNLWININKLNGWISNFKEIYLPKLSENEKTILENYFHNWVNNYFVKYVDLFEIKNRNNNALSSSDYCNLFNNLYEKYIHNNGVGEHVLAEGIDSEWEYSNFIYENVSDNVLKNYDYCFPFKHSLTFVLKKETSYEMTQNLLSDVYIYRPYKFWNRETDDTKLPVDVNCVYTIVNSFYKKLKGLISKKDIDKPSETDINDEDKLSLYLTLKNLYDKWKVNIYDNKEKWAYPNRTTLNNENILVNNTKSEYQNYKFVDSNHNNIGNDVLVDCNYLVKYINTILENPNSNLSLYEFMYQIADSCNMLMLSLPIGNYMTEFNSEKMSEIFKPNFNLMSSLSNGLEGSTHMLIYNDLPSSKLDIGNQIGDYEYTNDGIDLANTLNIYYYNNDGKQVDDSIPCFMVNYGQQNQSMFKNIRVNMDNPQVTEYSIAQQFYIANKYGDGASNQGFFKGQNLFNVYSNHSYTCTVDMMGCANITPYMHFYLNGMPLFKGVYMIISVKHHIEAGNMVTTFTGVRQNINRLPFTKEALYLSTFKNKINILDNNQNDSISFTDTYVGYNANILKSEYDVEVADESVDNYMEYDNLRKLTREYNGNIYPLVFFKQDQYYNSSPEKTAESAWKYLHKSMKKIIVKLARIIEKNNLPYGILITSAYRGSGNYPIPTKEKSVSYHERGLAVDIHGIDLSSSNAMSGRSNFNFNEDIITKEQLFEKNINREYSPYLFDLIAQTCYNDISELFWENLQNANNGDKEVSNTIHFAIHDERIGDTKKTISQGVVNGKYKKYSINTNSDKIFEPLSRFFLKICSRLLIDEYEGKKTDVISSLSNFNVNGEFIDEVSELKKKILKF